MQQFGIGSLGVIQFSLLFVIVVLLSGYPYLKWVGYALWSLLEKEGGYIGSLIFNFRSYLLKLSMTSVSHFDRLTVELRCILAEHHDLSFSCCAEN